MGRTLPYQPALDGVRALAISGVVALHANIPFLLGGGLGVWVFFTLSGYLITTLLLREAARSGGIRRGRFYARRALRLLPALFVLVAVCDLWAWASGPGIRQCQTLGGTLGVLFYAGNWIRALDHHQTLGAFAHTWSLSVEEQFYIVWPLIVLVLMRLGHPRGAVVATLAGVLLSIGARALATYVSGYGPRVREGTDSIADQLLVGCALALFLHHWPSGPAHDRFATALRWAVWPASILLAAIVLWPEQIGLYSPQFILIGLPSLVSLCSVVLIGFLVTSPGSLGARMLGVAPLAWLGRISYSLYLWHVPVFVVLGGAHLRPLGRITLGIALSLALAAASYYLVELPVLRLRKRAVPAPRLGVALREREPDAGAVHVVPDRGALRG